MYWSFTAVGISSRIGFSCCARIWIAFWSSNLHQKRQRSPPYRCWHPGELSIQEVILILQCEPYDWTMKIPGVAVCGSHSANQLAGLRFRWCQFRSIWFCIFSILNGMFPFTEWEYGRPASNLCIVQVTVALFSIVALLILSSSHGFVGIWVALTFYMSLRAFAGFWRWVWDVDSLKVANIVWLVWVCCRIGTGTGPWAFLRGWEMRKNERMQKPCFGIVRFEGVVSWCMTCDRKSRFVLCADRKSPLPYHPHKWNEVNY